MIDDFNLQEYQTLLNDYKTNVLPNITDFNNPFFKKWEFSILYSDVNGLLLVKFSKSYNRINHD
jgi:hypothetical protein